MSVFRIGFGPKCFHCEFCQNFLPSADDLFTLWVKKKKEIHVIKNLFLKKLKIKKPNNFWLVLGEVLFIITRRNRNMKIHKKKKPFLLKKLKF